MSKNQTFLYSILNGLNIWKQDQFVQTILWCSKTCLEITLCFISQTCFRMAVWKTDWKPGQIFTAYSLIVWKLASILNSTFNIHTILDHLNTVLGQYTVTVLEFGKSHLEVFL
jgi:hypothetical protein